MKTVAPRFGRISGMTDTVSLASSSIAEEAATRAVTKEACNSDEPSHLCTVYETEMKPPRPVIWD